MPVSVEIMDAMTGRPAEGARLALWRRDDLATAKPEGRCARYADAQGRVRWSGSMQSRGVYRLAVDLDTYFGALGVEPFQSRIEVEFRIFEAGESVAMMLTVSPTTMVLSRLAGALDESHR
jgi:5-hydroxyisourate hydrolase-like protein (transthyretin family)